MAMDKVVCPACGQDWVGPMRIKATGKIIFICGDCETTWPSLDAVGGEQHGENFTEFMEAQGLRGVWLEDLEDVKPA